MDKVFRLALNLAEYSFTDGNSITYKFTAQTLLFIPFTVTVGNDELNASLLIDIFESGEIVVQALYGDEVIGQCTYHIDTVKISDICKWAEGFDWDINAQRKLGT